VVLTVQLWMPGGRLLLPAVALVMVLIGGLGGARVVPMAVTVGLAAAWTGPVVDKAERFHSLRTDNEAGTAARHLAAHLPAGEWVVVRDAGWMAYALGPSLHVFESSPRALTRVHPGGVDSPPGDLPVPDPAAIIRTVTARDVRSDAFYYPSDRHVWGAVDSSRYRRLGRVEQHIHRYYDVYVRTDLVVPPLPGGLGSPNGNQPR
jgi:hypothetical protein